MIFVKGISQFKSYASKVEQFRNRFERELVLMNKKAAIMLDRWVQKNFEEEGFLHNDKSLVWPELSETTKALRTRNTEDSIKVLQDTGRLKTSFDIAANREGGILWNEVQYAELHEEGGKTESGAKVPQRKMFPDDQQALEIIAPVYEDSINELTKKLR